MVAVSFAASRADVRALLAFSSTEEHFTLRQPDGTRTDRGRIYILYGPPSSTERKLNPSGAYREVWTYGRLGRTFVFEDQNRSGNYLLVPSGGT